MNIIIADDHPITLHGTKDFVTSLGYTVVDICYNGITAFNLISVHKPDIAILDINMPGMDGLEIAKKIKEQQIPCRVILQTMLDDYSVYKKALEYGVYGYLLKNFSMEEIEECLRTVVANKPFVSPHLESELAIRPGGDQTDALSGLTLIEKKIVEMIGHQKSSKQIGDSLFLGEKAIEYHRKNIIEKLNLPKEKNALLIWALQRNMGEAR
jgi:DNA-binding NarL/FixJ family response regulator